MKITSKILIDLSRSNGLIGGFCTSALLNRAADAIERNNVIEAVEILKPLSESGNATAQMGLGSLYATGILIPQDLDKGVLLLTQSAEQRNTKAQLELAKLYEKLEEKEPAYKENKDHWCNVLASEGHEDALLWKASQLGESISLDMPHGDDDWKKQNNLIVDIVDLLLKSALQGNAYAQYRLAAIYKTTFDDKIEAYAWLSYSAAQGNEEAKNVIREAQSELTNDQYHQALKRIKELIQALTNYISPCRKGEHGQAVTVKLNQAFFCERMKKLADNEEIGFSKEETLYFSSLIDALAK